MLTTNDILIAVRARDEATAILKKVQAEAKALGVNASKSIGGVSDSFKGASKNLSGFQKFMQEGRQENRMFSFAMGELRDILVLASVGMMAFGSSSDKAEASINKLMQGIIIGVSSFQALTLIVPGVVSVYNFLTSSIRTVTSANVAANIAFDENLKKMRKSAVGAVDFAGALGKSLQQSLQQTSTLMGRLTLAVGRLKASLKSITLPGWFGIIAAAISIGIALWATFRKNTDEAAGAMGSAAYNAKKLRDAEEKLNKELIVGSDEWKKQRDVVDNLKSSTESYENSIKNLKSAQEQYDKLVGQDKVKIQENLLLLQLDIAFAEKKIKKTKEEIEILRAKQSSSLNELTIDVKNLNLKKEDLKVTEGKLAKYKEEYKNIQDTLKLLQALEPVQGSLGALQKKISHETDILNNRLVINSEAWRKQKEYVEGLSEEYNKLNESLKKSTFISGSLAALEDEVNKKFEKLNNTININSTEFKQLYTEYIKSKEALDAFKKSLEGVSYETGSLSELEAKLSDLQEKKKNTSIENTNAHKLYQQQIDSLISTIYRYNNLNKIKISIEGLGKKELQYNINAAKEYLKTLEEGTEEYNNLVAAIEEYKSALLGIVASEKDLEKQRRETFRDLVEQSLSQGVSLYIEALNQATQDQALFYEKERDNIEKTYDARIEAVKGNAEAELLLEKQKKAALQRNEDAKNKLNAEGFEKNRKASIAQIAINTAVAAMKVYRDLGIPLGIIAAAFVSGLGLYQASIVSSQKNPYAHSGGQFFVDAPANRDVPITVRGQETIKVMTPHQANASDNKAIVINFNSPVSDSQFITNSIKKVLRDTGLKLDKAFTVNRNKLSLV